MIIISIVQEMRLRKYLLLGLMLLQNFTCFYNDKVFPYLRAIEHIRCVLIEDDGLPVDVPGGGQSQAGG